jgi:release factor glutamine methyltransferase
MAMACWATGRDRSWFAARTFDEIQASLRPEEQALIQVLTDRRLAGEPLAYLLGFREFYGHAFFVNRAVLIPRADTECLLEEALSHLSALALAGSHPSDGCQPTGLKVLDLGTGSGCLAISLALAAKARGLNLALTATDQSAAALAVARNNAYWLGAKVEFAQGDWYQALGSVPQQFDLIVSNPPYIGASDPHLGQGDLPYEPLSALAGRQPAADGLTDLRTIVDGAGPWLRGGGRLMVEHGYDQQPAVISLMRAAGFVNVNGLSDLSGTPRLVTGQL